MAISRKDAIDKNGNISFSFFNSEEKKINANLCVIDEIVPCENNINGKKSGNKLQCVSFSDGKEYTFKENEFIKDNPNNIKKLYLDGEAKTIAKRQQVRMDTKGVDINYIKKFINLCEKYPEYMYSLIDDEIRNP